METKEKVKNTKEKTSLVKKGDFVELEFIGKDSEGNIFDTNIREKAEQANLPDVDKETDNEQKNKGAKRYKPLAICVGQKMLLPALDAALEAKAVGKQHTLRLQPEQAFGKRNPSLVKTMPLHVFTEKNVMPQSGMIYALDNLIVKIISVSGGRVIADFNNPLAGKQIVYEFKILKKLSDIKEKINAMQDFFFGKRFDFNIDTKNKKIILKGDDKNKIPEQILSFNEKFKQTVGLELSLETKKSEKKPENKEKNDNKTEKK